MNLNKERIKDLMDSKNGKKMLRHVNNCEICQTLYKMTGAFVEKHLNEEENKEKLI